MQEPTEGRDWCVYALRCRNNYLYIGSTNNLEKRLKEHASGKGSKFVRTWRPFEVSKVIPCDNGREARRLEYRLKRLRRPQKLQFLGIDCGNVLRRFSLEEESPDAETISAILNKGVYEHFQRL